jgi:hypothetical protein
VRRLTVGERNGISLSCSRNPIGSAATRASKQQDKRRLEEGAHAATVAVDGVGYKSSNPHVKQILSGGQFFRRRTIIRNVSIYVRTVKHEPLAPRRVRGRGGGAPLRRGRGRGWTGFAGPVAAGVAPLPQHDQRSPDRVSRHSATPRSASGAGPARPPVWPASSGRARGRRGPGRGAGRLGRAGREARPAGASSSACS